MKGRFKDWPEYVLFFVGVGGAVLLLFGPSIGIKASANPMAYTGVGAILTYVLTQGRVLKRYAEKKEHDKETSEKSEMKETENDAV